MPYQLDTAADGPTGIDPVDLATVEAYDARLAVFVDDLNHLHIEYGARSYGEICGASETRRLTKAGIADLLNGKRLPRVDFLLEFVRVVSNPFPVDGEKPRGYKADPALIEHWRRRWVDLKALNRQIQSPLSRIRNATKQLIEDAARAAETTTGTAEEHARGVRSAAEAEAALLLADARQRAARLLNAADERAAVVRTEAESEARRIREEASEVLAAATREAVERVDGADLVLRGARTEAETVRRTAQAEAERLVDEVRRSGRLRTSAALRALREHAEHLTERELPALAKRFAGDPAWLTETALTVPSAGIHSRDDVGRLARCFDILYRDLVSLAAEQALLRGNINAMSTALARRAQLLAHRQLTLLDALERRDTDPALLTELHTLDHLATRMRRHHETLLVLTGAAPGRRWTRPVPLVDVIRAAASEVEHYERVEHTDVPPAEVADAAVTDLTHLLAELLENATEFSHPKTRVRVTGHALPDGRVLVEIHDSGLGLGSGDLAEINERLANPPTVDVSVPHRMGLFVVGHLALRHDIRVQLRPGLNGGAVALVMLPARTVALAPARAPVAEAAD
ncbi:ATP-binding protein [Kitasatospora sp. NPDC056184]|uniref:sensor histidine kinase n=1 Tax=Kitasatospora sp. NPDC056184 TaxID=3345738 RepID=UPI0035D737C0